MYGLGHKSGAQNFVLDSERRVVWMRGVSLTLGKRPFALLTVLVAQVGNIVTQRELIEQVWPENGVNSASLRVHVSALARSLEAATGEQLIMNEHGRGYRLLGEAPAGIANVRMHEHAHPPAAERSLTLPVMQQRLIGRDDVLDSVAAGLVTHRLVSIVGPGGSGKTTVAVAVATLLQAEFEDGAFFVDLSLLDDPDALAQFVWQAVGLPEAQGTTLPNLTSALAQKSILLLLDNCEHLIEASAELCETIVPAAPGVRILATSREALRAVNEKVVRLPTMAYPCDEVTDVVAALQFPAIQLFVEQATACGSELSMGAPEARKIAWICAALDGLPLAIKFAAGLLSVLSLDEIATGIDSYLLDLGDGRRKSSPRHQTLIATLDWSFRLLVSDEKTLLTWLSLFQGGFTLDAAVSLAAGAHLSRDRVPSLLANLIAKSLVNVRHTGNRAVYCLLETMRHFARQRLEEAGDLEAARIRHAQLMIELARAAEQTRSTTLRSEWIARHSDLVADIRFAVSWALMEGADKKVGIAVLLGAIPLRMAYWTPLEFLKRLRCALAVVEAAPWATVMDRVVLRYEIGHMLNISRGETELLEQISAIGEEPDGPVDLQIPERFMSRWVTNFTHGLYDVSLDSAHGLAKLAQETGRPELTVVAQRILAQSLHFSGEQEFAKSMAEKVLATTFHQLPYSLIGHDVSMRIILSRIAFLRGAPEEATEIAAEAALLAARVNCMNQCQALGLAAIPVAIWRGDLERAGTLVVALQAAASESRLDFWSRWADDLHRAIDWMAGNRPSQHFWLAEAKISPKVIDFLATVAPDLCTDRAVARVEAGSVGWNASEVMRSTALKLIVSEPERARLLLRSAHQIAEVQGATVWLDRVTNTLDDLGWSIQAH